jgi:hypothetical protein
MSSVCSNFCCPCCLCVYSEEKEDIGRQVIISSPLSEDDDIITEEDLRILKAQTDFRGLEGGWTPPISNQGAASWYIKED